jgi:hypothetical protein
MRVRTHSASLIQTLAHVFWSEILLLPSQSQPLSLHGHGGAISDFPNACVPINHVATNGICSPEAVAENLGQNSEDLREISGAQEVVSGSRIGATPDVDPIQNVDPRVASPRSVTPVAGPDPRVAPLAIGSLVRSVNRRELFPGVHVSLGQGDTGFSVHLPGCFASSLDTPAIRFGVCVEASGSSEAFSVPAASVPSRPSTRL